MKIIKVDNFDREIYSDELIADKIPSAELAQFMVDALNEKYSGTYSPHFYRYVEDAYVLFEPSY